MKKIVFLEGLPTVGKTYLVNEIRKNLMFFYLYFKKRSAQLSAFSFIIAYKQFICHFKEVL